MDIFMPIDNSIVADNATISLIGHLRYYWIAIKPYADQMHLDI